MGKNSDIGWTNNTWNPWMGCHKVSPGCKNCYWFRDAARFGRDPEKVVKSKTKFKEPLKWKKPAMVFTCSWSDFFIKEADPWRDEAWDIIRRTPHLTYQILTKRPERICECLPEDWPLENVWLGVTAENQEMADIRIPLLLNISAKIHFVSVEPMLEPIYFNKIPSFDIQGNDNDFENTCGHYDAPWDEYLDWVICGGESGSGFREMKKEWAFDLIQQTEIPRIPFFMKQMAGVRPKTIPIPERLNVREFPKAGR